MHVKAGEMGKREVGEVADTHSHTHGTAQHTHTLKKNNVETQASGALGIPSRDDAW